MRTRPSNVLLQFLNRRRVYITDADGKHEAKKIKVAFECIGFSQPDEIVGLARMLLKKVRGHGRRRKFVALELTAHPSDENEAEDSFLSRQEMEKVAMELVKEFHGVYALVGYHGLRDVHVLILNWGPTGLALKSYLPNRSNPRRVLVAVVDRVEREIIAARKAKKDVLLRPMNEVRDGKRKAHGRLPMYDQIATHLPLDREPEIADLLEAIKACGWSGSVKYQRRRNGVDVPQKASISFNPSHRPKSLEWDVFERSAKRALRKRREKRKETDLCEQLVDQVHRFIQGRALSQVARDWLEFGPSEITTMPALADILRANDSEAAKELNAALKNAKTILAERNCGLDNEPDLATPGV